MKRRKPYSLYALIIAFGAHAAVIVVFLLLFWYVSEALSSPMPPRQEHRVKLSLKENPAVAKEALVKNDVPKKTEALPIPRGEQLIKPAVPTPESSVSETQSQSDPIPEQAEHTAAAEPVAVHDNPMVQELYGDVFTDLSAGEQKFILDNQENMRRITQNVLARYAPYRIPPDLEMNSSNMVEFYLHPDGSVSDVRFLQSSMVYLLDSVTLETLEIAYKKYPRPEQKTLIRYKIEYVLGGN